MAAEEPQQQKQEPLGSDSEGTDRGRAVRPGLAGTVPGLRFPRRLGAGRPGAKRTDGPFFPASPPLPLTMESAAAATPGRAGGQAGGAGPGPRPLPLARARGGAWGAPPPA